MIEKYFRAGIRFQWTKPRDSTGPMDATFVDSRQPAAALVYDGLDGKYVDPYFKMVNISTLGLQMRMPVHHAWLDYAPGRISRLPIGPYDVLTGYMSGCIIVQWSEKGVRYAGHIGTVDGRADINRAVKRKFAFGMARDTRGFNPFAAWPNSDIVPAMRALGGAADPKIFGLVTTRGDFFSVLMIRMPDGWVAAGVKPVQPIQHDALKLMMLRD